MEVNTAVLVALGVFFLWLGTTNRLKYVVPAFNAVMAKNDNLLSGGGAW